MKKAPLLFFATILLLGFLFFTLLVHFDLFTAPDLFITENLQKFIPRSLDTPFSLFSLFGSFEIVLLIILILWVLNKKLNYFYILLYFGLFHVVEILGKLFVDHPNPSSIFSRYDIFFSFPSSGVNTGSSFPSGHMGRTMFMAIILLSIIYHSKKLSRLQKKISYLVIVTIVFLMFTSRIYLGEHWLSDVLGGSLLGAAFGFLSLIFIKNR